MSHFPETALLKTLATLVEHGGISGASRATSTPKSTLSRHLTQLEQIVGVPIVDRSHPQFALTEPGRILHQHAHRLLRGFSDMMSAVSSAEPKGLLKVSTTYSLFSYALRPILPAFLEQYPELDLYLETTSAHKNLADGSIDLALRGGALSGGDLIARRLGRVTLGLYAAPREDGSALSVGLAQEPAADRRSRPRVTLNDPGLVKDMVADGHGRAWLPDYICAADVKLGRLARVAGTLGKQGPEVFVLYTKTDVLPVKSRVFIDFLVSSLRMQTL